MKKNTARIFSYLLLLAVFLFTGCGGGTVGTDDGASLRLSGTIVDGAGKTVSNALVIVEATGDEDLTDEQGHFEIISDKVEESRLRIDASISQQEVSLTSSVLRFNQSSDSYTFEIVVSVEQGLVTVEDLDVTPVVPTTTPSARETPASIRPAFSRLSGIVRDQFGKDIRGVRITIEGARTSTITNQGGSFELPFQSDRDRLGLLFEYQKRRARISLKGLPAEPSVVRLKLTLVVLDKNEIEAQSDQPLALQYEFQVAPRR